MKKSVKYTGIVLLCIGVVVTGFYCMHNDTEVNDSFFLPEGSTAVSMNEITFEHPGWKDGIVLEKDGRFHRLSMPGEKGKIVKNDDKTVTLIWDRWAPEVFQVKDDTHYVFLKRLKKTTE